MVPSIYDVHKIFWFLPPFSLSYFVHFYDAPLNEEYSFQLFVVVSHIYSV